MIDAEIEARIQTTLSEIERREDVRILFAIESGSRAWGFPSPDSDYDVRFVFLRPLDWYLSIYPGRDVIELPIDDELDVNGWDLQKALRLLLKPNPVLLEWLTSPIRYRWDEMSCDNLLDLSSKITHGRACLNHYLSLGKSQWKTYVEGKTEVNLKKYFYVLRPAMAIRWLRLHPEEAPPMNFHELMSKAELPDATTNLIEALLEKKKVSKEFGLGAREAELDDFILAELQWAEDNAALAPKPSLDFSSQADEVFRALVGKA